MEISKEVEVEVANELSSEFEFFDEKPDIYINLFI